MHDDRGIEPYDIFALMHHGTPPFVHDVAFELGSKRTIVITALEAAVDLAGLENETPLLAQRDDLLHEVELVFGSRLRGVHSILEILSEKSEKTFSAKELRQERDYFSQALQVYLYQAATVAGPAGAASASRQENCGFLTCKCLEITPSIN